MVEKELVAVRTFENAVNKKQIAQVWAKCPTLRGQGPACRRQGFLFLRNGARACGHRRHFSSRAGVFENAKQFAFSNPVTTIIKIKTQLS
jgi:hypothetical protein